MAGFGAGFGKAFGGSLEAAGKLHQEEQLRSREYERAKTDRQAEIADTRSYNERIAAEDRARIAENETHRYSKGPDGKFYYTTLEGTLVEKDPNSPGVKLYLEAEEKRGQERTMFGLDVEGKKVGIQRDKAAIGASIEQTRAARAARETAAAKGLNVFAELAPSQRDIVKSIAKYGPYANISDGRGNMIPITTEMVSAARALESSKNPAAAYQAAVDLKDILSNSVVGPAPVRKDGQDDTRVFATTPSKVPGNKTPSFNATPGWSLNNYRK
jgi:hypothetical protein